MSTSGLYDQSSHSSKFLVEDEALEGRDVNSITLRVAHKKGKFKYVGVTVGLCAGVFTACSGCRMASFFCEVS